MFGGIVVSILRLLSSVLDIIDSGDMNDDMLLFLLGIFFVLLLVARYIRRFEPQVTPLAEITKYV